MTLGIAQRHDEVNGIRLHWAEAGAGPAVLLCHGWPETWFSWRQQIAALAGAGYRAIAPDMRGYGESGAPAAVDVYTILHLVGDMVALLDRLGIAEAVIVGHDWGAPVAWHAALVAARPIPCRGGDERRTHRETRQPAARGLPARRPRRVLLALFRAAGHRRSGIGA